MLTNDIWVSCFFYFNNLKSHSPHNNTFQVSLIKCYVALQITILRLRSHFSPVLKIKIQFKDCQNSLMFSISFYTKCDIHLAHTFQLYWKYTHKRNLHLETDAITLHAIIICTVSSRSKSILNFIEEML